jgi:cytochrome c oxidase assembly protein subunit 15
MLQRPAVPAPRPRAISTWLILIALLILAMVMVGGITRLTESGLSITRWDPISGAIPPLTEADWQAQFDAYRATPQYAQVNSGMSLADFKTIFFWEYVHRLLGRLIGLAFALPLLWFWWRRAIPQGYGWKLVGILCLGGLQGVIGWWMVVSGLVDRTEVSHVRLAVHLLTALAIYSACIWVALDLRLARARLPLIGIWALCALALQLMFGAYVAGLRAGYAFNTWPMMGDEWFPAAAPMMEPFTRNLVDNPIVVQFIHRWLAFVVAFFAIWLAMKAWLRGLRLEATALVGAVCVQIVLGILTLLSGVKIDIAVAHQGMAVLLLAAMLTAAHRIGEPRPAA